MKTFGAPLVAALAALVVQTAAYDVNVQIYTTPDCSDAGVTKSWTGTEGYESDCMVLDNMQAYKFAAMDTGSAVKCSAHFFQSSDCKIDFGYVTDTDTCENMPVGSVKLTCWRTGA